MGHFVAPDGKIYVDTDFINRVQRLPGCSVNHMGFGEFELVTKEGKVEFDRMRGKEFEGQSGRSHAFYDSEGHSNRLALKIVKEMEQHNLSEPAQGSKTAAEGKLAPDQRVDRLLACINETSGKMIRQLARHGGFATAVRVGHLETLQGQLREIDSCKRVLERAFSDAPRTANDASWKESYGPDLSVSDNTVGTQEALGYGPDLSVSDNTVGAVAGTQTRPLHEIAKEIRADWKSVNYAARPYLEAMGDLDKITDNYGQDAARSIVRYFLTNATSWRGPKAKEIKAELNKMVK